MARAIVIAGTLLVVLHATPKTAEAAPDPDQVAQAADEAQVDQTDLLGALLTVHEDDPRTYLRGVGDLPPLREPVVPPKLTTPASGVWDALAYCESRGNWSTATGNGFYGGLQFDLPSWRAAGGSGRPDQASRSEQIRVGQNWQRIRGWSAWPVCSRVVGLR